MNCNDFETKVTDLARGQMMDAGARDRALAHAADCRRCAARLEDEQRLSAGLSVGLAYWFVLGLIQGVTQERIEDQDRRVANQGIRRSLRNSVIISVVSGTIIGSIGILSYVLRYVLSVGLSIGLSEWLSVGLSLGSLIGISGALLICMLTGGLANFRHYTIRSLLSRSHTFPGRAPRFLNDATTRILLRRIGGGYSFVHRLLLDHLADAAGQSTERASTSMAPPSSPASS